MDTRRQYASIKAEIDAAVHRVLESGYYATGPETKAFEEEWAAYCGKAYCVALGNGTTALSLPLRALGIGPGDEVITAAFTISATFDAILDISAMPVLVDVDPATYTIDPSRIEAAITDHTRAIMPVHIYGHAADMDAVVAIAGRHGLPVVSDACEAAGTTYKGRPVASFGTVSGFSFYPTKTLGTTGDAGGIVTDDAALADGVRRLRNHGWDRRFHSTASSLNSRMDEIHAAVLRAKLPHLEAWNMRRRAIARRYDDALVGSKIRPAPNAHWGESCYYLYVAATSRRDDLRAALQDAGIASDVHWPEPPHLQPAFEHLGYQRGSLPVTERLCAEIVTLPMFPELTDAEVERICAVLRQFDRGERSG
jgi:dTDP-4-amino-4,6-dideoxygalactose transaminase